VIRLVVRPVMIASLVFAAIALLIRTQPYDERAPIAVLVPIHCRVPCFMDIRPGVTSIDDAITLLRHNEWVSRVIPLPNEIHPNQVNWLWSDKAPAYLSRGSSRLDGQLFSTTDRKIAQINFDTSLTIDDVLSILGDPKEDGLIVAGSLTTRIDPRSKALIQLFFPAYHLWVTGIQSCPYYTNFGQLSTSINITDSHIRDPLNTPFKIVQHNNLLSSLHSLSLQTCGF